MVAEPELVVRLARLRAELEGDTAAMKARAAEVVDLVALWDRQADLRRPELVLLAVNLHGWYTALETALERIARLMDQSVPDGPAWHIDLIAQMYLDVPGVRPAVLPKAVAPALQELRKFRHFFRNAYVLDLDPALVRERAISLSQIGGPVAAGLAALQTLLAATIAELAQRSVDR